MANVLSIVSYKIFPAKFGGQKGIANFNEYFSKHHNLYCLTVKANDANAAPYTIINKLSNSKVRYVNIFYFKLIKKIIREHNISHVIIEHPYYGWLGLLLKKFCKIKLIIHSHNIEAERFKTTGKWWWKILWEYEKYVHTQADFTFCITENDRYYFTNAYKLPLSRTAVITFGISWNSPPSLAERSQARIAILNKYCLSEETVLFLFNGALEYPPNLNAVQNIVLYINPAFIKKNIPYKIIICGKNLPVEMNELKEYRDANIIYAGYVDDITVYFKGINIFINPVTDGGGIKTKLVEALGYDMNAVSTINGAIGVDASICNGKMLLSENDEWQTFAEKMAEVSSINQSISNAFFDNFFWDNIAKKAAVIIDEL